MLDRIGPNAALGITMASSHSVPPANSPRSPPGLGSGRASGSQHGQDAGTGRPSRSRTADTAAVRSG